MSHPCDFYPEFRIECLGCEYQDPDAKTPDIYPQSGVCLPLGSPLPGAGQFTQPPTRFELQHAHSVAARARCVMPDPALLAVETSTFQRIQP